MHSNFLRLALLSLSAPLLSAQTTVTFSNQEEKSAALSTTGGLTLGVASGNALQSGAISGTGTLTKTGAGTLTLGGSLGFSNSVSNGVSVSGGTLDLATANDQTWNVANTALATGTTLRKSGAGTLTFGATNSTITSNGAASFDLAEGNLFLGTGRTLTFSSSANPLTLSGSAPITVNGTLIASTGTVISGDVNLGNGGSGTITLDGATVYSGTGSINAATINGPTAAKTTTLIANEYFPLSLSTLNAWAGNVAISGTGGVFITNANMTSTTASASLADGSSLHIGGSLQGNINGVGNTTFTTSLGTVSVTTSRTLNFSSTGTMEIGGMFSVSPSAILNFGTGTVLDPNIVISGLGTTVLGGVYVPVNALVNTANIGGPSAGNTTTLETPRDFDTMTGWAGKLDVVGNGTATIGTAAITSGTNAEASVGSTATFEIGALNGGNSTAALTKSGTGLLSITGTGSYLGSVILSEGTLSLGTSTSLQNSTLNLNGGTLAVGNLTALTLGGLTGLQGLALQNDSAAALALTLGNNNTSSSYSGALTGAGSLLKVGTGTLTLTGTNTYSGGTTVSNGLIQIDADSRLGSGALTLNGGGIRYGAAFDNLRTFALGTAGATLDTNSFNVTYAGALTGSGAVTKTGAGVLTLSGTNTYSGGTTVTGGLLSSGSLTHLGSGLLTFNGGGLQWGLSSSVDLTANTQFNRALGSAGGIFDTNGNNVTFANALSGTGALTKAGSGTLTLSVANTYSGGTKLAAGTLAFGSDDAFGSGAITFSGGYSTLRGSGTRTLANNIVFSSGITAYINGDTGLTLSGAFSGAADSNVILIGSTTFSGNNQNYTGAITVGQGIVYDGSLLTVTNNRGLGATSAPVSVEIKSTLALDNVAIGANPLALNGTGINGNGALLGIGNSSFAGTISLLQNTPTIGVAANGTFTLSGVISSPFDTQVLTKVGDGKLVLSGNNTYVGATLVNAGTLSIANTNALGTSYTGTSVVSGASIELQGGASISDQRLTLDGTGFNNTGALRNLSGNNTWNSEILLSSAGRLQSDAGLLTLAGAFNATGLGQDLAAGGTGDIYFAGPLGNIVLTKFGSGTLTISGTHSLKNVVTILDGRLQLGEGGALSNLGSVTGIVNNGVLALNTSSDLRVEKTVSGTGALEQLGSGKLTLVQANTYSGGTVIKAGSLEYYDVNGLGTGAVTLDGGELLLNPSGLSNDLLIGSAGGSLNTYAATTISSSIADAGANAGTLVKTGDGTLTITGTNTHTGGLRIAVGLINFSTLASLGSGGVNLDGGGLQWATGNTIDVTSAAQLGLTLGGGGGVFDTNSNNITFASSLAGTGGLTKSGLGMLTLSAANTFTGAVQISYGTLRIANANAVSSSSGIYLGINGAIQLAGDTGTDFSTSLTAPPTSNFDILSDRLTAGTGVTHSLDSLTIGAQRVTVTKGTNVTSGTAGLAIDSVTVTGDATLRAHASGTYLSIGSITASGGPRNITLNGSSGTILVSGPINLGTGSVTKDGGSTLTLSGTNTFTGGLTVVAGTLRATSDVSALGSGTLTLSGGALQLANDTGLDFGRNTTVSAAATITSDRLTSGAGVLHSLGDLSIGTFTLSIAKGANVANGTPGIAFDDVTATGNATFSVASGTRLSFNKITGTNRNLSFASVGDTAVNGAIATGTGTLAKSGAGLLTLSGANTFTGAVSVSAGTLRATNNASALGAGTLTLSGGALQLANDSGLAFNRNTTVSSATTITSDRLTSGSGVTHTLGTLSIGAQTLTIAAGSNVTTDSAGIAFGDVTVTGNSTFSTGANARLSLTKITGTNRSLTFTGTGNTEVSGAIATGTGTLTKSGTGTLTLAGTNTYTGATNLNAGKLLLNGSLANTAVTVNSGATLGGSGTIGGLTTFNTGAHLAAGNSPGTLTFTGGLTLNNGAILDFELGTTSDLILVSGGTFTGSAAAGGITLNFTESSGFVEGTYTLVDFTGATLSGVDLSDFTLGTIVSGYNYSLGFAGNQLVLTATAVPEPATFALFAGLAILALGIARRRRRR